MNSTTADASNFTVVLDLFKATATNMIFENSNSPIASWATTCFSFVIALIPRPICLPPSLRVAPWSSLRNFDSSVRSRPTPNDSRTYSPWAYTMTYCWSADPIDCMPTAVPNFSSLHLATRSGNWNHLKKLCQILRPFLHMSFNLARLSFWHLVCALGNFPTSWHRLGLPTHKVLLPTAAAVSAQHSNTRLVDAS